MARGTLDEKNIIKVDFIVGRKKCPFMLNPTLHALGGCVKENCMFWNEEAQDCNINVLAKKL